MSAVLDLNRLRRTRRFPWDSAPLDESMPDGTTATQVLTPRVLQMPAEGSGMQGAALSPAPVEPYPLDAPQQQVFSAGQPPPTLQPATPLRRTITFTPPPVEEMPSEPLAPIPPEALSAQRRYTKPTFQSTGDQTADLAGYDQRLSEWRDPADRNGRLKSFGLGALRGALRGLAAGGAGGAIGGALAGGIHGGVAPNADEREWRDAERGRVRGALAERTALEDAALNRRGKLAGVLKTEAERDALLNPQPKEITPHYETRDDGTYVRDAQNPEGRRLAGIPGKPSPEKARQREWIDDGQGNEVLHQYDEAGVPQLVMRGEKPVTRPGKQMVTRTLKDGTPVRVPSTTALTEEATIEAANITAAAQGGAYVVDADNKNADRRFDDEMARFNDAVQRTNRVTELRQQLKAKIAERDAAATRASYAKGNEDFAKEEAARERADEEALALTATLKRESSAAEATGYAYATPETENWAVSLKPRPTAPSVKAKPAPQRRSGAAPARQGGGQAPAVRNATPGSVMSVIERIRGRQR